MGLSLKTGLSGDTIAQILAIAAQLLSENRSSARYNRIA